MFPNPNGRPRRSRNKRTQEILDLIQERGDKDPLDFLSEVISSENHYTVDQKISAANYLNPYLHSKRSVAPEPRFIREPIEVPVFQSIHEAESFLAALPARVARGEIGFEDGEKIDLAVGDRRGCLPDPRSVETYELATNARHVCSRSRSHVQVACT